MASSTNLSLQQHRLSNDTVYDCIEEIDCRGSFIEESSGIIQNITQYLKENGLVSISLIVQKSSNTTIKDLFFVL